MEIKSCKYNLLKNVFMSVILIALALCCTLFLEAFNSGVVVQAQEPENQIYNIIFDSNGGNTLSGITYTSGDNQQTITLLAPEKEDYVFIDWEITKNTTPESSIVDGNLIIPALATGDINLLANYKEQTYSIEINVDGGEPIDSLEYSKREFMQQMFLGVTVKTNAHFYGWIITKNCNPAAEIDEYTLYIPQNAKGDIIIEAVWTYFYTITFDINAVDQFGLELPQIPTLEQDQTTVYYGFEYGQLPELKQEGYVFEGWYLDKDFTKTVDSKTIVKQQEDHILYAKWSKEIIEVNPLQLVLIVIIILVSLAFIVITYVLIYKK